MIIIVSIVISIFVSIVSFAVICVFFGVKEGLYNDMFNVVHKYYPKICFDDFINLPFKEALILYKRTKKELKEEARKRIIKELNTIRGIKNEFSSIKSATTTSKSRLKSRGKTSTYLAYKKYTS